MTDSKMDHRRDRDTTSSFQKSKSLSSTISMDSTSSSSNLNYSNKTKLSALQQLLRPDGYYTYLQIPKPTLSTTPSHHSLNSESTTSPDSSKNHEIDEDLVLKNYRRLSLRHHPDRRGGDAETFRILNRAKKVLTHSKLRKQYDLLGFDLEDEEEEDEVENDYEDENQRVEDKEEKHSYGQESNPKHDVTPSEDDRKKKEEKENHEQKSRSKSRSSTQNHSSSRPDSIMNHLASSTLAFLLQVIIRTVMMTLVSTVLCRYLLTVIPFLVLLLYTSFRIWKDKKTMGSSNHQLHMIHSIDIMSPILIGVGILLMYHSKKIWNWKFWLGENFVMTLFIYNSTMNHNKVSESSSILTASIKILVVIFMSCSLLTLYLRGKWGRYIWVILLESFLALITVLVFPMMEMFMEHILNDKLRKIGEKFRAHTKRLEELQRQIIEEEEKRAGEEEKDKGEEKTRRKS